jgi:hypothetical protein
VCAPPCRTAVSNATLSIRRPFQPCANNALSTHTHLPRPAGRSSTGRRGSVPAADVASACAYVARS